MRIFPTCVVTKRDASPTLTTAGIKHACIQIVSKNLLVCQGIYRVIGESLLNRLRNVNTALLKVDFGGEVTVGYPTFTQLL